jgi:hypothetical protein
MRGGANPTSEVIARTLILAAAHMDELSMWVLADERVLKGELEISSRWVALAALGAIYPAVQPYVLGLYVGGGVDSVEQLAFARCQRWWDEQLVQRVMVQTLSASDPSILMCNGAARCAERALRGLLHDRLRIIHRSVPNVG